ncbi:hypothetical protein B5M09_000826 [Aphanomyces astaci]|uniref:Uncharacterized protein n=1 Tax=Aphanomyces astaci TaxID=112090 RepID=A0A425D9Q6_APHAT|nr:hypothetical protein B5M09_000826 [Aphanomyces astaci]
MQSAEDLERDFIVGQGRGFSNMSNVGRWMMSLSVAELATVSDNVYILTAGAYPIQAATMKYCGGLNGSNSVQSWMTA